MLFEKFATQRNGENNLFTILTVLVYIKTLLYINYVK